jgi:serine/threonine protein kinase
MKKDAKLTGNKGTYIILKDFEVTGGMSKVTFATLDGKEYFLKEFLSPKYPVDTSKAGGSTTIEKKKQKCKKFEEHHKSLNDKIATKSGVGGNLVCTFDFFRSGTTYFKVTEKIDITSMSIGEIARMSEEQKLLIMKTVTSSLKILHDLNIVHGDLKPDNVLIKKTTLDAYTTKLIDFDNSYISGNPPENNEDAIGDQVYYSPELAKYIIGKADTKAKDLTIKSDVFALGVLFSQYITGNRPEIESKYKYVWQAVLDGCIPVVKKVAVPNYIIGLISKMLALNPTDRPDISKVFDVLKGINVTEFDISISTPDKPETGSTVSRESGLKGSLVKPTEDKTEPDPKTPKLKGKLIDKK